MDITIFNRWKIYGHVIAEPHYTWIHQAAVRCRNRGRHTVWECSNIKAKLE